jgi:tetratricopeptide (TPR) repeat protein
LWLEVAKILYERKHYSSSELIYKNLLPSDANHRSFEITKDIRETALFQLARISSRENRYGDAIKHYQQLLQSNPYHGVTLINLGLALARENRHREAVDILTKADEHNTRGPKKAKALAAKGISLMELGDTIAAQAALEQSILYRPQDAPT